MKHKYVFPSVFLEDNKAEYMLEQCKIISLKEDKDERLNKRMLKTIWSIDDRYMIEGTFIMMKSFIVPQMQSMEMKFTFHNYTGKAKIKFYPLEQIRLKNSSISGIKLYSYDRDKYGLFLELDDDRCGLLGSYVLKEMNCKVIQKGIESYLPTCLECLVLREDKDFRIYQYFILENKNEDDAEAKLNQMIATVCMLPIEDWYQQQDLFVQKNIQENLM